MKHLRAIIASPKTSIPGIVMVLGAIGAVATDWTALFKPKEATVIVGGFVTGIGLLMAADVPAETTMKPPVRRLHKCP